MELGLPGVWLACIYPNVSQTIVRQYGKNSFGSITIGAIQRSEGEDLQLSFV
jgi:hypothetical protein